MSFGDVCSVVVVVSSSDLSNWLHFCNFSISSWRRCCRTIKVLRSLVVDKLAKRGLLDRRLFGVSTLMFVECMHQIHRSETSISIKVATLVICSMQYLYLISLKLKYSKSKDQD